MPEVETVTASSDAAPAVEESAANVELETVAVEPESAQAVESEAAEPSAEADAEA